MSKLDRPHAAAWHPHDPGNEGLIVDAFSSDLKYLIPWELERCCQSGECAGAVRGTSVCMLSEAPDHIFWVGRPR
jgi:hypothetical protein